MLIPGSRTHPKIQVMLTGTMFAVKTWMECFLWKELGSPYHPTKPSEDGVNSDLKFFIKYPREKMVKETVGNNECDPG